MSGAKKLCQKREITDENIIMACKKVKTDSQDLQPSTSSNPGSFWFAVASVLTVGNYSKSHKNREISTLSTRLRLRWSRCKDFKDKVSLEIDTSNEQSTAKRPLNPVQQDFSEDAGFHAMDDVCEVMPEVCKKTEGIVGELICDTALESEGSAQEFKSDFDKLREAFEEEGVVEEEDMEGEGMSKKNNAFRHCENVLTAQQAYDFLTSTDIANYTALPPISPRNGDIFFFLPNSSSSRDWRADQLQFKWYSSNSYKVSGGRIKKTKYVAKHVKPDQEGDFVKFIFCVEGDSLNRSLIQYIGDEKSIECRPHGNRKSGKITSGCKIPFFSTAPSVIQNIKKKSHDPPMQVYMKERNTVVPKGYEAVLCPRNVKQVQNIQTAQRSELKLSRDDIYSLIELRNVIGGFVVKLELLNDFHCILANNDILEEVRRNCGDANAEFCCDTTFNFGDFYVTTLVFSHPAFVNAKTVPVYIMLHQRRTFETHDEFFKYIASASPELNNQKCKIVTDRERAITQAIDKNLPNMERFICWNHIREDVSTWAHKHGGTTVDKTMYSSCVYTLMNCDSLDSYNLKLTELRSEWDPAFSDYFEKFVEADIKAHAGRWVLEESNMYKKDSGITSNASESFHSFLRRLQMNRESSMESFVVSMYQLTVFEHREIQRGLCGLGNFILKDDIALMDPTKVDFDQNALTPDQILEIAQGKRLEEKKSLSNPSLLPRVSLAQSLIQNPSGISLNPLQGIFTVRGINKDFYIVKLFPKRSCTCKAMRKCHHVIACEMAVGMEGTEDAQEGTLSNLYKRNRGKGKTGRKYTTRTTLAFTKTSSSNLGELTSVKRATVTSQVKRGLSARMATVVDVTPSEMEEISFISPADTSDDQMPTLTAEEISCMMPTLMAEKSTMSCITQEEVMQKQSQKTISDEKEEIPCKKQRNTKTSTPMKHLKDTTDKATKVSSKQSSKQLNSGASSGLSKGKSICVPGNEKKNVEKVTVGNEEIELDWTLVNDINGLSIREVNVESLSGQRWVDEMIIDAFIALQCQKIRENNKAISATYIPSTYYSIFAEEWDAKKILSSRFMLFCATNQIWKNDIIFIPVHIENHWILAIVVPQNKIIYYVDGLYKMCKKQIVKLLSVLMKVLSYICDDYANFDVAQWSCLKPQDAVKQVGGYNCGVYVCVWPYIIANQREIDFTNAKVTRFRQIIREEITKKTAEVVKIHHGDNETYTIPGKGNSLWVDVDKQTMKVEIVPDLEIGRFLSQLINALQTSNE